MSYICISISIHIFLCWFNWIIYWHFIVLGKGTEQNDLTEQHCEWDSVINQSTGVLLCLSCVPWCSAGRSGVWTHDLLRESCLRCSWTHPGQDLHRLRGESEIEWVRENTGHCIILNIGCCPYIPTTCINIRVALKGVDAVFRFDMCWGLYKFE